MTMMTALCKKNQWYLTSRALSLASSKPSVTSLGWRPFNNAPTHSAWNYKQGLLLHTKYSGI